MDVRESLVDYTETEIIDRSGATQQPDVGPRTDRRKASLKSLIYGAFKPRRRQIRRAEDANYTFLDLHPRHLLVVSTIVMVLSVIDGLFTVRLINAGLQELNPVLAPLVHGDAGLFALTKIFFTAVGVCALVLTSHARVWGSIPVARIFYGLMLTYGCVIIYELYLVQFI